MPKKLNLSEFKKLKPRSRQSKYRNTHTIVDGIKFASKKEAARYQQLKKLKQAGVIRDLRLQPRFKLVDEITYVADFEYHEVTTGRRIVEDVKGYRTREYKKKRRLVQEQHAIEIKEV